MCVFLFFHFSCVVIRRVQREILRISKLCTIIVVHAVEESSGVTRGQIRLSKLHTNRIVFYETIRKINLFFGVLVRT